MVLQPSWSCESTRSAREVSDGNTGYVRRVQKTLHSSGSSRGFKAAELS